MIFNSRDGVVMAHAIPGVTINCAIRGVTSVDEAATRTHHAHHRACQICKDTRGGGDFPCKSSAPKATH